MMCENCKKNPVFAQVIMQSGTQMKTKNICKVCFDKYIKNNPEVSENGINLNESFNSFVQMIAENANKKALLKKKIEKPTCSFCKTEIGSFDKKQILGCEHCYKTFKDEINNQILEISGCQNSPEISPEISPEYFINKIKDLKIKLQKAIDKEKYELAAKLRDKIAKLENKK